MATNIKPLMTIADLEAMPDDGNRYEIIEGELFVSCAPGLTHQRVLGNILFLIRTHLHSNPIGEIILTPGLILSEYSGVIPDLVFFRHETSEKIVSRERLVGAPDVVVEIVSPGSENVRRDRIAKRQLYAKYAVPEYWIVDLAEQALEVYEQQSDTLELVGTFQGADEVVSKALPAFRCLTAEIFRVR